MISMIRLFALALALCAAATATSAEVRSMCFEPGTAVMTPEGYAAARATASDLGSAPPWKAHVVLRLAGGREATGLQAERRFEALLELVRADIAITAIREVDGPVVADCVELEVDQSPHMATWHYYGPYFEPDSAVVSGLWRRSLRFVVAPHRSGEWKFCIQGHADTGEASPEVLSRVRAENVARELIRQGVPDADIETRAYGDTLLVRANAGGPEPLNRRVFIDIRTSCRFDR